MKSPKAVSRRGALTGIGALAGVGLLADPVGATASLNSVLAAPKARHSFAPINNTAPLGSPLKQGWTYRYLSYMDFIPLDFSGGRSLGGISMAFANSNGFLRATLDLPFGAQIGDLELYCDNNFLDSVFVEFSLWQPGVLDLIYLTAWKIPHGVGQVLNQAVSAGPSGPYPPGTKLVIEIRDTYL